MNIQFHKKKHKNRSSYKMSFFKVSSLSFFIAFLFLGSCQQSEKTSLPSELMLCPMPSGSVMPKGWIKEQMSIDLEKGLAGGYERIWPNVSMNLFVKQERAQGMVTVKHGDVESQQRAWWAGEHEGYWKDAILRLAFLTGNTTYQARVHQWMKEILEAAEKNNGYIGIYTPESRFPKEGPDAELWTQSRIFQAMFGYYDFTGNKEVLDAIERATLLTLRTYRDSVGTYYGRPGADGDGGTSHGIGFAETLENLYRLTGNTEFRDGIVWLYDDFSNSLCTQNPDLQLDKLLDKDLVFQKHTPHIVEGLYVPELCAKITGNRVYKEAADNLKYKIAYHSSPAGNFVGSEWVHGEMGTGETWGEYCSLTESVPSYNKLVSWFGDCSAADRIEKTVFNAAQAARFHPENVAVQYLGSDNQYGAFDKTVHGGRTVYAGYHKAAACCTLNSGRIMPYYIDGMWYRLKEDGLVAMLFGPSLLKTTVKGVDVSIEEQTFYPFSDKVTFVVKTEKPVAFSLRIRKPKGHGNIEITNEEVDNEVNSGQYIVINKTWKGTSQIQVDFNFDVRIETANDSTSYYAWGPLLFSLPIPSDISIKEELKLIGGLNSGFYEYAIKPLTDANFWNKKIEKEMPFKVSYTEEKDTLHPWTKPPFSLKGMFINDKNEKESVSLLPHGSLLLRRLTFPEYKNK